MGINEAFVVSTPSNMDDDISAINRANTSGLGALRYFVTEKEVTRPPSGVFKKGSTNWGALGTFPLEQLKNVTDETRNTNQTEEVTMKNELNIEVGATLINNVPSADFTEDQIIDMIKAENAKIEALESVTKDSVNINGKIEVCKINIELLIDILDEDEDIVE